MRECFLFGLIQALTATLEFESNINMVRMKQTRASTRLSSENYSFHRSDGNKLVNQALRQIETSECSRRTVKNNSSFRTISSCLSAPHLKKNDDCTDKAKSTNSFDRDSQLLWLLIKCDGRLVFFTTMLRETRYLLLVLVFSLNFATKSNASLRADSI